MRLVLRPIVATAAALVLACAPTPPPTYAPASTTSSSLDGRPALSFPIPVDGPRGTLEVTSLGLARVMPPSEAETHEFRALYVRMIVANQSADVWTIDQAEQRIEVEEGGQKVNVYATTPTNIRPPVVQVAPGTTHPFDLVFGLPRRASPPTGFDLAWTVKAGDRTVRGLASFVQRSEPAATSTSPVYEPNPAAQAPYTLPPRYTLPR